MTEFLPRSAWTNDPFPAGAALLVPAEVRGLAVHWPGGSGSVPTTRAATVQILAGELAFHTGPPPAGRGWSDIAYNYAVDQEGRVWELRGINRRSAANGDTDVNRAYVAVTCLIGPKDIPSPQLLQAVRDLRIRMLLNHYPKAVQVVPHSAIRPEPTDCPGDRLRAHIAAGTLTRSTDIQEADMPLNDTDLAAVEAAAKRAVRSYFIDPPAQDLRDIGDGAASPPLRLLQMAGKQALLARNAVASVAAAVAGLDQVDEAALAADLAPLLVKALPSQVQHFTDADLAAIADAVSDERDARERTRLGS